MKKLWQQSKFLFLFFLIVSASASLLSLALEVPFAYLVEYFDKALISGDSSLKNLYYQIIYYVSFYLLALIFSWFMQTWKWKLTHKIISLTIRKIEEQFIKSNYEYINDFNGSKYFLIIARNSRMVANRFVLIVNIISTFLTLIVFALLSFALFSYWTLTFMLCIILVSGLPLIFLTKRKKEYLEKRNNSEEHFYTKLEDLLNGFSRFYFSNKQKLIAKQVENENIKWFKKTTNIKTLNQ
ncbi:ABC TRANSPORTER PERMEASE PROTEIN (MDR HOMOLOG) [Mycoplasmopsis pulmonis]|uniref:ABC TRANSPORTER PERMEASE PROTEIN (MDR HOMOLOG) n=1 Tax=Mycoplasmopsis pulmonis (strain UAB CTIP) TaxID=272635 RepID=Q98RG9_MYCPU|nr:hypothetical protein [Mycoplasmopsis pulmonis]CAC13213.1 ABC TRANSPORTER PERMEASE PROTEIN (MDR HOMOLOG) [Mycoplasmopsis pulmonis]VEU67833.1 Uncharacterised protein [Mycoplasmopsis pulmonis]